MTIGQRIRFYQQLAMSSKAGIPIHTSMERLKDKISSSAVADLAVRLGAGEKVGPAFEAVGAFSPFECNLIRVGMQTARLEDIFTHLADYWNRENQLGATLIAQAIYPAIIIHVAIFISALPSAVMSGLFAFIFTLVWNFCMVYFTVVPLGVAIAYTWHTDLGQSFWIRWPLIGDALRTTYIFRWVTALRLEYEAGIGLPDAVSDAWKASGFPGCNTRAAEAETSLLEGNLLSALMKQWPLLPRDWSDFIESGEQAGSLETTLNTLGEEAAYTAGVAQDRLRTWLPRIVFVLMMFVVGYLVMSALFAFLKPIMNMQF